jgi:hypothetical protein
LFVPFHDSLHFHIFFCVCFWCFSISRFWVLCLILPLSSSLAVCSLYLWESQSSHCFEV